MIKNIGIITLFLLSCQSQESDQNISGYWKISFSGFNEVRYGDMVLKDDHTGIMYINDDPESLLIRGEDEFAFDWNLTNDRLILTRHDNNFMLSYSVQSFSQDQIKLFFADEVEVLLLR